VASTAVKVFGAEEAALHARRPLICHRVQRGSQELQLATTPSEQPMRERERDRRKKNHDSRQDLSDRKKERSHHHHHQQITKTHLHP
jgi:hypothetical protein